MLGICFQDLHWLYLQHLASCKDGSWRGLYIFLNPRLLQSSTVSSRRGSMQISSSCFTPPKSSQTRSRSFSECLRRYNDILVISRNSSPIVIRCAKPICARLRHSDIIHTHTHGLSTGQYVPVCLFDVVFLRLFTPNPRSFCKRASLQGPA